MGRNIFICLFHARFLSLCTCLAFVFFCNKAYGEDIFPPFYSVESREFDKEVIEKISFRPFFTVYRNVKGGEKTFEQLQALWPFIFYQKNDDRRKFRFWPVMFVNEVKREDGIDKDTAVLPILVYGSDPAEGKYFGVFPLGGRAKGLLGREKIDWVLFPLYARAEYKGFVSTHYAFPFLNHSYGPRKDGFRFWPFWGYYKIYSDDKKKDLTEDRKFLFWPFWVKQIRYYPNGHVGRSLVSFPLYARYDAPSKKEVAYVWPFYKRTEFPKTNEVYYTLLWPVIKWGGGHQDQKIVRDIWPIFGYKKNLDYKRYYYLWPFVRFEKELNKDHENKRFWFLPFFWQHTYKDLKTNQDRKTVKVWPFYEYKKNADGEKGVDILSIFWFKDSVKGGFQNNYAPFFNIWSLRYEKNKWYDLKALFHLIHLKKNEDERKTRLLGFVFDYHRKPEEKKVSILSGLLEYKEKDGYRKYKFLWIPFSKKSKHSDKAVTPRE